jgi:hypothetical protein
MEDRLIKQIDLRQLRGIPLSLVLAFAQANQPVSLYRLAEVTGYSDKPVRRALAYLASIGWVRQAGQAWELNTEVLDSLPTGLEGSVSGGLTSPVRKLSANSTNTTASNQLNNKVNRSSHHKHVPGQPKNSQKSKKDLAEVSQALFEAGINEPKRSLLANLPNLTAENVRAWETQLKQAKGERYQPGLLVYVLESGDPPPRVRSRQDYADWETG